LPAGAPRRWENVFTGKTLELGTRAGILYLHQVFDEFPAALLAATSR
jgi:hypothetical protein